MENNKKNLPSTAATPTRAGADVVEIDLVELFNEFLAHWPMLLAGLLAGILAAGMITYFLITPKFTATSKLYMVSSSSNSMLDLSDFNIGNSMSSDYEQLIITRPVIEEVIEDEELDMTYEQLKQLVSISTISNTRILTISVTTASPKMSMTIANALADKAVEEIPVLMDTAKPNIAERAITPTQKSSPSMKKNVAVGGILGLLVVMGFLTLGYITNDTLNTAEDVEKMLGIMPMTVIPETPFSGDYDYDDGKKSKRRWHKTKKVKHKGGKA